MSEPRGWCPGALRPMESGDGWVMRIRPRRGRVLPAQAAGIAKAAREYGNGLIDLTGRANLQLRGVTPESHTPLLKALSGFDLIDPDTATERRRNIIVTPFSDADTDALAAELERVLAASTLNLPAKFGFAVDTGHAPVLQDAPADIRLERDRDGHVILRADGASMGARLGGVDDVLALAEWFLQQGGAVRGRGRMAALVSRGAMPPQAGAVPAPAQPQPVPGQVPQGLLVAVEFGQLTADILAALAEAGPLRVTPWRMLLIEGVARSPKLPGLILDPADPRLRLRACPGAPACRHAYAETRQLARRLATYMPETGLLHVSGCAKGCAWPGRADVTLTAAPEGFDLIRNGTAKDDPQLRGLPPERLHEVL